MATKTLNGGISAGSLTVLEIPMVSDGSSDLEDSGLRRVRVSVSAAEVAALRATPKEIVAAPGAGYIVVPIEGSVILDYTAPGYTESSDNLVLKYNDGSGTACSEVVECTGFIDQTADTITNIFGKKDIIVAAASMANKKVVLHNNGDGEFGGSGGSSLTVDLTYRVIATGL